MAKETKTKEKEEELVDLTPKPEKVTDEELEALQATIRSIDRLTIDIGRIETQKFAMIEAIQNVQKEIEAKRQEFLTKYGTDNVNIQTGEIAYAPENPETSETSENGEVNS